jgi:hypothetical protein
LAFLIGLALGCGAHASYEGGLYRDGDVAFRIEPMPAPWETVEVGDARHSIAFARADVGAVAQGRASCEPGLAVPLPALRNHLLSGFTAREEVDEATVPFDGREALRSHVRAKLDGVPRELLLYVTKKDGCVYDFALVSSPERFAEVTPSYERFVQSFRTVDP